VQQQQNPKGQYKSENLVLPHSLQPQELHQYNVGKRIDPETEPVLTKAHSIILACMLSSRIRHIKEIISMAPMAIATRVTTRSILSACIPDGVDCRMNTHVKDQKIKA
jgi:hypothetical protein